MADKQRVKKAGNPMKILGRLFGTIFKYYKLPCLAVLVLIIFSSLASVAGTMFMKSLIDVYIVPYLTMEHPDFAPLAGALSGLACIYLCGVICTYAYNRIMVNVSQGTLRNIRNSLFAHMETLPIRYFDTHSHGDIMSIYTNDTDTLRQIISQTLPQTVSSLITLVSVFCSMLVLSPTLTCITIIMVGIMLLISSKVASLSGKYFMTQQSCLGSVNGYIEEMMEGQKVVKVFCHEGKNTEQFKELNNELFDSADHANRYANILMPIMMNMANINYVVTAIVGAVLSITGAGSLTLGTLASFLQFNKSFSQPISQMSQQLNSIVMALAGAERIFRLLDEEAETDDGYVELVNAVEYEDGSLSEVKERTGIWAWKHFHKADGTVTYQKVRGDVVLDHVDFGYNEEKRALEDVEVYARPGEKIAFVGATGAGKTTITNLLNRFYDILDGKIRYDGINPTFG